MNRNKIFRIYILLFFLPILAVWTFLPSAQAKLDPAAEIISKVVRPNILIIMDVSGSMMKDPDGNDLLDPDPNGRTYGAHEQSRLAIAKRVLDLVLNKTRDIANFGLMTYWQTHFGLSSTKGYYPYFDSGEGELIRKEKYCPKPYLSSPQFTVNEIDKQPANSGKPDYEPVDSYELNYMKYFLREKDNSLYMRTVKGNPHFVDMNYCGYQAQIVDPITGTKFTWTYQGSYYYWFQKPDKDQLIYFKKYYGPAFISDGTEDDNGGASWPVDPNHTFIYYQGVNDENFKYVACASHPSAYPVEAKDLNEQMQGGILLVPFSFSSEQGVQNTVVNKILQWMGPQNDGGLIATGYTPIGSALKNAHDDTDYYNDAYSYFVNEVDPNDPLWCRKNYILLITDGEPEPVSEGALAITAASELYNNPNLPVTVYVVGFGSDTAGSAILSQIASAGGSGSAFYANNERALLRILLHIIFTSAAGDYATSAPSVSSAINLDPIGNIGLLATCEFPDWNGHLKAYDLISKTILWDAGEQLDENHIAYNARKIFTSDPKTNSLIPFFVNGLPNYVVLHKLGLGASEAEAWHAAHFISGKFNFWRLYDITNCTPICIGPPYSELGNNIFPGHDVFEATYADRKPVVYCGANDCMLHCFDMVTGKELWAYVPTDLLPKITTLYSNDGQSASPREHIYGVAASPKAYDVYVDSAWKTIVICGEGPGGHNYFALDVTHPSPADVNYDASAPFSVLWHTGDAARDNYFGPLVGESWSAPALSTIMEGGSPKCVAFIGSGYDDLSSAPVEGLTFMAVKFDSDPFMGKIVFSGNVGSPATIVDHALVSDAVCYSKKGLATDAYIADTAGKIWHVNTENGIPGSWPMVTIYDAGVDQPFFYSPAVLQINYGECTMIVAGSGTYDDPNINKEGSTFLPKIYFIGLDEKDSLSGAPVVIPITDVEMDPNAGNFPTRARISTSPIIIQNQKSAQYEAVFLIYVPPPAVGCDLGSSYIVVFKLNNFGSCGFSNQQRIKTLYAGEGKVTGIGLAGESAILVGQSGFGSGSQSNLEAVPSTPKLLTGQVQEVYWKEYD